MNQRFLVRHRSSRIPRRSGEFNQVYVARRGQEARIVGIAARDLEEALMAEEGGELVLTPSIDRAIRNRPVSSELRSGIPFSVLS